MKIEEFLKLVKLALNPKWKWVAMDQNGTWNLYSKKPKIVLVGYLYYSGWCADEYTTLCCCRYEDSFKIDRAPDWKKSLIKISDVA